MSQISAIFGTDDDSEIMQSLYLIANVSRHSCFISFGFNISDCCVMTQNTAGLGLIHESVDIYDGTYTRQWFAWANSYFAEMLLDLASRKPHLIFTDGEPYTPGQS